MVSVEIQIHLIGIYQKYWFTDSLEIKWIGAICENNFRSILLVVQAHAAKDMEFIKLQHMWCSAKARFNKMKTPPKKEPNKDDI